MKVVGWRALFERHARLVRVAWRWRARARAAERDRDDARELYRGAVAALAAERKKTEPEDPLVTLYSSGLASAIVLLAGLSPANREEALRRMRALAARGDPFDTRTKELMCGGAHGEED